MPPGVAERSAAMSQHLQVSQNLTTCDGHVRWELRIKHHVRLKTLHCCVVTGYCCLNCPMSFWRENLTELKCASCLKMQSNKVWLCCVCIFVLDATVCIFWLFFALLRTTRISRLFGFLLPASWASIPWKKLTGSLLSTLSSDKVNLEIMWTRFS